MKWKIAAITGVTLAVAVAPHANARVSASEAFSLGAQAYSYGFPLTETLRVRATMTSVQCATDMGNAPVNAFSHVSRFPGPADRLIVAPNVDTLYSIAHLDLGAGPVVLEHPDMGTRYFVFQLLDPYTNTVGYIGSRTTGSSARRFAITWSGAPGTPPPDTTTVTVADRRIWVIGRTLASDAADQLAARALMRQMTLTAPGAATPAPDCTGPMPQPTQAPRLTGIAFLDALSAAMEENPPPARDAGWLARLAPIGVGPGRRTSTAGLGPAARRAAADGANFVDRFLGPAATAAQAVGALRGRGWANPPANIGDYGTDYGTRAGVAQVGLGANTREEAVYQTALFDSRGRRLDGRNSYRLRFAPGQEPPADAFWSITVYDEAGFLIDAPEQRNSVGSAGRPPLVRRADGTVEVVFSRTRPTDPDVNWLPVPSARFQPYLRVYAPRMPALTGAWQPPSITRLAG